MAGYKGLPAINPETRVRSDTARHDRISLLFGDWVLDPVTHHQALGIYDILSGQIGLPEQRGESWFARPTGTDPTRPKLALRSGGPGRGSRLAQGRPLITGQLQAWGPKGESLEEDRPTWRRLALTASINPTRFMHHQEALPWSRLPSAEWSLPDPTLNAREAVLSTTTGEASLDGNDNVLLTRSSILFARPDAWRQHLSRYWSGLLNELDHRINAAADAVDARCALRPQVNLTSAQTYWEFQSEDPIAWIVEAEPYLRSLGLSSNSRSYGWEEGYSADEIKQNSRRVQVRLSPGRWLTVYAKTTRRIRFEIEHRLKEKPRLLSGGHTSADYGALLLWLDTLTEDATSQLNIVFERLARLRLRRGTDLSVTQLIARVTNIVTAAPIAEAILSALAANGFVTIGERSLIAPAIRQLVSAGILEPVAPRSSNYVLAPQFRAARERLGYALRRELSTTLK